MDRIRINRGIFSVSKFLMRPIYKIYEKMLWLQIKNGPFPAHIGIIPDGNRRWAKRSGFDPKQGHEYGYQRIKDALNWIWELNIRYVTLYAMSSENCLYRPLDERRHLFNIVKKGLQELINMPEIHEKKIQIKVFGRLELVPKDIVELAHKIEEQTKHYKEYRLNIALCYGGRQEILEAVRKIVKDAQSGKINPENIDEETFSRYLYTNGCPDPDLIIRTSGEVRISNFLLWQSAYSELYFCEAYWPEFRKIDFWRAIRSYQRRERRYGR